ncbi:hypothetical protein V8C43DRAFT_327234 [Trichoderma afarasin]
MSTDLIRIDDEEAGNSCTEILDSSQIELVEPLVDARKPRRKRGKQVNYKECSSNTDSETLDATHEPGAESEDAADDIQALREITPVKTRSRAKKEKENSEGWTPSPLRRLNSKKRGHDDDQSETSRPTKRGRPTATNSEIKTFERDALGLVERFSTKSREFEAIRSENDDLKRQVKLLESALKQEQEDRLQIETVQSEEVHRLQYECKRLTIKLISVIDEANKDAGKYIKVSDSEIEEHWRLLSRNIRSLVSECLTENPADPDTALESLVKSHRFLSTHDISTLRVSILRRTVWRNAILPVFSGRQCIWQGELGAILTEFLSTKNNSHIGDAKYLQIISNIKSRAVAELSDEGHINVEAMGMLIGKVTKQFSPFIPDSKMGEFMNDIKELITTAANIHYIMMKSKAIFLTQWIGDDDGKKLVPFDQTKMVSSQYDRHVDAYNSLVKFVEAPALVKIGTADGEKFDTSMVLCESWVVLESNDDDTDKDDDDIVEHGDDIVKDDDNIAEKSDAIVEDGDDVTENNDAIVGDGDDVTENSDAIVEDSDDVTEDGDGVTEDGDGVTEDGDYITEDDYLTEDGDDIAEVGDDSVKDGHGDIGDNE